MFRLMLALSSVSGASLLQFEAVAWAAAPARVLTAFVICPRKRDLQDTSVWDGMGRAWGKDQCRC